MSAAPSPSSTSPSAQLSPLIRPEPSDLNTSALAVPHPRPQVFAAARFLALLERRSGTSNALRRLPACACHQTHGGAGKDQRADQCRHRIARQSEDRRALPHAQRQRAARLQRNAPFLHGTCVTQAAPTCDPRPRQRRRPRSGSHPFAPQRHQDARAARHGRPAALPRSTGTKPNCRISASSIGRLASKICPLPAGLPGFDQFIASGEHTHPQRQPHRKLRQPGGRGQRQIGRRGNPTCGQDNFASGNVLACLAGVRALLSAGR